jgi:putative MATE family efflux protein
MNTDMTKGSIVKTLAVFCAPLVLSGLLQQLYSWTDAFIVGNVNGELHLAAIGATGSVSGLIISLITGFSVGISILSAYLFGSGEKDEIKHVLSSFTIVLSVIFTIICLLGILLSGPALRLLKTPDDIMEISKAYIQIIMAGLPFLMVYNIYSAVLRGVGDSKTALWAIVVSAVSNIILDILFVYGLGFGASGAAVATVISQVFMAVFIVLYSAKKYPYLSFKISKHSVNRKILFRGFRLSIPTALQACVHSTGNLLLQNFMNSFGTQTVAAITTAYRVDSIIMLPMLNLGAGVSTIVAQNTGAGNHTRAKKGMFVGMGLIAVTSVLITSMVIPTGGILISLFGVTEEAVLIGQRFFSIIAMFYLPFGIATAIKGYLDGVGDVIFSSIANIVALIVRIVLSFSYRPVYGNDIIALAESVCWLVLLGICIVRFVLISRKRK